MAMIEMKGQLDGTNSVVLIAKKIAGVQAAIVVSNDRVVASMMMQAEPGVRIDPIRLAKVISDMASEYITVLQRANDELDAETDAAKAAH